MVTGSGRGIGREHALSLARHGALVVVNDLGAGVDGSGGDISPAQQVVNGTVRLVLYKGAIRVSGRKSADSLYNMDFATFEDDSVYRQHDAEGFIRLNALRLRIQKMAGRQLD